MATKITYTQQGDYLLPDLKLPEQPKVENTMAAENVCSAAGKEDNIAVEKETG